MENDFTALAAKDSHDPEHLSENYLFNSTRPTGEHVVVHEADGVTKHLLLAIDHTTQLGMETISAAKWDIFEKVLELLSTVNTTDCQETPASTGAEWERLLDELTRLEDIRNKALQLAIRPAGTIDALAGEFQYVLNAHDEETQRCGEHSAKSSATGTGKDFSIHDSCT